MSRVFNRMVAHVPGAVTRVLVLVGWFWAGTSEARMRAWTHRVLAAVDDNLADLGGDDEPPRCGDAVAEDHVPAILAAMREDDMATVNELIRLLRANDPKAAQRMVYGLGLHLMAE